MFANALTFANVGTAAAFEKSTRTSELQPLKVFVIPCYSAVPADDRFVRYTSRSATQFWNVAFRPCVVNFLRLDRFTTSSAEQP